MKLGSNDYLLCRIAAQMGGMLRELGELETRILKNRIVGIDARSPVYITGLARGGTTILLNALAGSSEFSTHRYRDFPFLFTPVFWHTLTARLASPTEKVERPHRDGIMISRESPEAFEELLWQHFFPDVHDPDKLHVLDDEVDHPVFEAFYREHIRKLLYLRGGTRYLCKGNYNVTRIRYIARLFPQARFVIAVRHPETHVSSLVRQHELFGEYSGSDPRIPDYLRVAGHYEFGPQRVAVNMNSESSKRIKAAWKSGDDSLGYAIQWSAIYQHVAELLESRELKGRIHVVRHEDLCAQPVEAFRALSRCLESSTADEEIFRQASLIQRADGSERPAGAKGTSGVWGETGLVAQRFGYRSGCAVEELPFQRAS